MFLTRLSAFFHQMISFFFPETVYFLKAMLFCTFFAPISLLFGVVFPFHLSVTSGVDHHLGVWNIVVANFCCINVLLAKSVEPLF